MVSTPPIGSALRDAGRITSLPRGRIQVEAGERFPPAADRVGALLRPRSRVEAVIWLVVLMTTAARYPAQADQPAPTAAGNNTILAGIEVSIGLTRQPAIWIGAASPTAADRTVRRPGTGVSPGQPEIGLGTTSLPSASAGMITRAAIGGGEVWRYPARIGAILQPVARIGVLAGLVSRTSGTTLPVARVVLRGDPARIDLRPGRLAPVRIRPSRGRWPSRGRPSRGRWPSRGRLRRCGLCRTARGQVPDPLVILIVIGLGRGVRAGPPILLLVRRALAQSPRLLAWVLLAAESGVPGPILAPAAALRRCLSRRVRPAVVLLPGKAGLAAPCGELALPLPVRPLPSLPRLALLLTILPWRVLLWPVLILAITTLIVLTLPIPALVVPRL